MAQDVSDLAAATGVSDRYATLGHSYGAFRRLAARRRLPGETARHDRGGGMAEARWLEEIDRQLATFEPVELREQVTSSWARKRGLQAEQEVSALLVDQMPSASPGRSCPREARTAPHPRCPPWCRGPSAGTLAPVRPLRAPDPVPAITTHAVGLRRQQRNDERLTPLPQQVRARLGQLPVQELLGVDKGLRGHRGALLSTTGEN